LNHEAEPSVAWYRNFRYMYEALAEKVAEIIQEILDSNKKNYYDIEKRAKTVESYAKKASKEEYRDNESEIMDMAGIRVITYTNLDAQEIAELIMEVFEIDPTHSKDKSEELGTDKVGYRGIHYIATLGKDRLRLPEYSIFEGLCFEIQVRSILQHAWAEFEHDRNYKFSGELPAKLRRDLYLVAGNLELADKEFDRIQGEIGQFNGDIERKMKSENLNMRIDSISLRIYMDDKFEDLVRQRYSYPSECERVIGELHTMGMSTLDKLESIIPEDFIGEATQVYEREMSFSSSYVGIIRSILMIYDISCYFKKAWQKKWNTIDRPQISLLKIYGVDIDDYIEKYGLEII